MNTLKQKISGFTLIELSIVLVIISLIVGGIVGGKALITASRIQSVITDINSFEVATNSFILQYDTIPGDMRDAYDYWNDKTTCSNNDINTTAGGCNGNGDNRLSTDFEDTLYWHHLSLSEIIPQTFSIGYWVPDVSAPKLALNDASIRPYYSTQFASGNRFRIATRPPNWLSGPAFTPKNARAIDRKIDDGKYDSGNFRGNNGQNPSGTYYNDCSSGNNWNVALNEIRCQGHYYISGIN